MILTAGDQTLPRGIPEDPVELNAHWIAKPGRASAEGLAIRGVQGCRRSVCGVRRPGL